MVETGDFCDHQADLCDVIKCYPGVNCSRGLQGTINPCSPCPKQMIGNGIMCEGNIFI